MAHILEQCKSLLLKDLHLDDLCECRAEEDKLPELASMHGWLGLLFEIQVKSQPLLFQLPLYIDKEAVGHD